MMKFVKTLMAAALLTTAIASSTVMAAYDLSNQGKTEKEDGDTLKTLVSHYGIDAPKEVWDLDSEKSEIVKSGDFNPKTAASDAAKKTGLVIRVKTFMKTVIDEAEKQSQSTFSVGVVQALRDLAKPVKITLSGIDINDSYMDDLSSGNGLLLVNLSVKQILKAFADSGKFLDPKIATLKGKLAILQKAKAFKVDSVENTEGETPAALLTKAEQAITGKNATESEKLTAAIDAFKSKDGGKTIDDLIKARTEKYDAGGHFEGLVKDVNDHTEVLAFDARLDKHAAQYTTAIEALERAKADLQKEKSDLGSAHTKERASLDKKIVELGAEILELKTRKSDLETQHATLQAQHNDLDKAHKKFKAVIDKVNGSKLFKESKVTLTDDDSAVDGLLAGIKSEDPTQKKLLEEFNDKFGGSSVDDVDSETTATTSIEALAKIIGDAKKNKLRITELEEKLASSTPSGDVVKKSELEAAKREIEDLKSKLLAATKSGSNDTQLPTFGGTTNTGTTTSTSADHRSSSPHQTGYHSSTIDEHHDSVDADAASDSGWTYNTQEKLWQHTNGKTQTSSQMLSQFSK
jgi:hypothetical protein